MNVKRVTELENFANDFNSSLKAAFDIYDNKEHDERKSMSQTQFESKIKKKTFSNTVFEEQEPWKPNQGVGTYFESFKKLTHKHDMNPWEILRVNHMVKRSYAKPPEFLCGRDVLPTNAVGKEFDEHSKANKSLVMLGALGRTIINKFVEDNTMRENKLKEKEQQIYDYKHSKPPVDINPWKCFNHTINEFSVPRIDQIHSFKVDRKRKFLITDPFKIPKKEGDFFDPEVKLI